MGFYFLQTDTSYWLFLFGFSTPSLLGDSQVKDLDLTKTIRAIKRLHHPFGETMLQSLALAYVKTGQADKADTVRRLAGLND